MFRCKECGNEVFKEDIYCRSCGKQIDFNSLINVEAEDTKKEKLVIEGKPKRKAFKAINKDRLKIIKKFKIEFKNNELIICILIILLFAAGYFINKNIYNDNISTGKVVDYSFFAKSGQELYFPFSTTNNEHEIKGGIYKITDNSAKAIKISDDIAGMLKIKGDWIYFVNYKDEFKIYKMKKDGTQKNKLSDIGVQMMTMQGNHIYFLASSDENKLYKMNLDGSKKQRLEDRINRYFLTGNKIYYTKADKLGTLFSMNFDGSLKKEVCKLNGRIVYANDNFIYFTEPSLQQVRENKDEPIDSLSIYGNGNLYKIRIDGQDKKLIIDENVEQIFFSNKNIYYNTNSVSSGSAVTSTVFHSYKVDLKGKNKVDLKFDGPIISIIDNWMYYVNFANNESKLFRTNLGNNRTETIESDIFGQ
ncbi:DUF5050 domain-containing protein [Clostridium sp. YIM B02515]|uniref:DUF5050 domain-containing protein n=1 Tax=Clostridium rhizosphaerae TaxID=2803861 RepID=A0ABS1T8S7_9CLOT|nr:DUF5050 domain-containing protein [Clostridium rhizosphaerae]MBL4935745.1 DUF5050 domain-containing protein [Clostridium rhizosphaerae]